MSNIANGTDNGQHIVNQPLTTGAAAEVSPDILRTAIDARITKVRPMATPIDQISRLAGSKHAGAMEVAYYSVDTKGISTTLTKNVDVIATDESDTGTIVELSVKDETIFSPSDTILFPGLKTEEGESLTAYVTSTDKGKIFAAVIGNYADTLKTGQLVVRMGRAATELDVQTPQFQAMPARKSNFCQIFKMQVEQSTLMRMADKEVGWNFSEQEEAAVIDMRLGMEKNFIFGKKMRLFDSAKNEYVYLTSGIWSQAAGEIKVDLESLDPASFVDMAQKIFTGNNGSRKRLLVGGSDFVAAISKLCLNDKIFVGQVRSKWGIETREISTNFGSLFILHSEVFDQCGHSGDAMALDQDFITKYTHIPFHPEKLDLRATGTRNTDAVVLTEASCLVLRNPSAHFRILSA